MKYPIERQERTLKNGMKVILMRKPGFVKSLFMIGIPAGGTNIYETRDGQKIVRPKGAAHFLEHQMFRLNGEDVTYPLAACRAQTNAYTTYTETCYFVWTNADPYPPLSLLIDFVQNLDIDEGSVEKEKGIILSEYRQYEQEPEMRLLHECFRSLYGSYPLRDDILGTEESISGMQVGDLQDFYQAWYDPAQLVLAGVTGQELEPIFDFIEKKEDAYPSHFSDLSRRVYPQEDEAIFRESFQTAMDVEMPYAAMAVKLNPQPDKKQAVREDWMLNLWLMSQFTAFNPDFQQWLSSRILASGMGAEADLSPYHGYMLIYGQTFQPEKFFALIQERLLEKQPLDAETFESLKIRSLGSALRVIEQFDTLASEHIRGKFEGFDPLEDPKILESITLDEINAFIAGQNFDRMARVLIAPANEVVQDEMGFESAEDGFGEVIFEDAQEEMSDLDEASGSLGIIG